MTALLEPPASPEVGLSSPSEPEPVRARAIVGSRRIGGLELTTWLDSVLYGVVCVFAVSAFGTTFGGTTYLVAGAVGVVVGLGVAIGALLWRRSALITGLLAVAAFFLFGGVAAVRDEAIAGVIPSPAAIAALVDGVIRGWVNLLTTLPPVGDTANLLAIPYLCGLVAAVVGGSISLRTKRPTLALVLPVGVLCVAILVGTAEEVWPNTQTAVFAGLCIAWGSLRQRAQQRSALPVGRSLRWIAALWTLVAAGAIAVLFTYAPIVTGNEQRYVLRDQIDPPIDLRDYPSPLAGFRRYLDDDLKDEVLFTVEGLPSGARIRLATLDRYDGLVFQTAGGQAEGQSSGVFERVGQQVPSPDEGQVAKVEVEVGAYDDIWLPGVGFVREIDFGGDRAGPIAADFRYNLATGSAVVPSGLERGDRYEATVVLPPQTPDGWEALAAATVDQPPVEDVPEILTRQAAAFSKEQTTDGGRVAAITSTLREQGYFSNGDVEVEKEVPSRAGHSADRLAELLEQDDRMIGNAEQYAAALALMARDRGVPARVVMGFEPEAATGGAVEVRGRDVTAWVEVALGDGSWVPLFPTPDQVLQQQVDKPPPLPNILTPPPPPTTMPKLVTQRSDDDRHDEDPPATAGFGLPFAVVVVGGTLAIPLLAIGGVTAAMAGLKQRRRNRRRRTGPPSTRIAAGWTEVTDLAVDLGDVIPDRCTRREAAVLLARPGVATLAEQSDATVFGPGDLAEVDVDRYWTDVELARQAMVSPLGRIERWKALVNPTSLRRRRERSTGAARRRRSPS